MVTGCDRSWAEINLDNVTHNLNEIRRYVGKSTKIMAVVKANAYGHGVVKLSRIIQESGADRFAVSCLDEALQLKGNGITIPIQILSRTSLERIEEVIDNHFIQTVFDLELAARLSQVACVKNKPATIHVKIDTGMSRMGFPCGAESLPKLVQIAGMPGLIFEGIFTHFSSADELDSNCTNEQFTKFRELCQRLAELGIHIPIKHVANSAAIIKYPYMHLDMVRPGIALYGLVKNQAIDANMIGLKPVMAFKARIICIQLIDAGIAIGYGRTYLTRKISLIATISAGYADGYPRRLSNASFVLICGQLAPVVGVICMDHCMADITNINTKVGIGETVTLFGGEESEEIAVENISHKLGTINYEVVCGIGMRVPRVYYQQGKIESAACYLRNH
jgi:alanine racemase